MAANTYTPMTPYKAPQGLVPPSPTAPRQAPVAPLQLPNILTPEGAKGFTNPGGRYIPTLQGGPEQRHGLDQYGTPHDTDPNFSSQAIDYDANVTPESRALKGLAASKSNRALVTPDFGTQGASNQTEAANYAGWAAQGILPSAGQNAANLGIHASQQQQLSMGNSAMGSGLQRGAARQSAMQNASMAPQMGAANLAQLAAQARQQGLANYAQQAGQMRGQDINQQLGAANIGLDSRQQNDQASNAYDELGNKIDTWQLGATGRGVSSQQGTAESIQDAYARWKQSEADRQAGYARDAAAAGAGAATIAAGSDRAFKKRVRTAEDDIKRALDRINGGA